MMIECPHCGEDIPDTAKACRYCGSDAETGWADAADIDYYSVDLEVDHATPASGGLPAKSLIGIIVLVGFLFVAARIGIVVSSMIIGGFGTFWLLTKLRK